VDNLASLALMSLCLQFPKLVDFLTLQPVRVLNGLNFDLLSVDGLTQLLFPDCFCLLQFPMKSLLFEPVSLEHLLDLSAFFLCLIVQVFYLFLQLLVAGFYATY